MRIPSLLWPFPWWTVAITATLLLLIPWAATLMRVRRHNRRLLEIGIQLRQAGLTTGSGLFAIGEEKNILLVSGEQLAVVDLAAWRAVQTLIWDQISALKIYDNRSDNIQFRLVSREGAQTRKITTHSITGFGRLFVEAAKAGKFVEYLQD
jgi:hypothetical protein